MNDANDVNNPPPGEHRERTIDELHAELAAHASHMREILAEIETRTAPPPQPRRLRLIHGAGGVLGLAGIGAALRSHPSIAAAALAMAILLPSSAPVPDALTPQPPVAEPAPVRPPPLEARPAPPTEPDADVEQGEPPTSAGEPASAAPVQTTTDQAPRAVTTTELESGSRRQQPTPGPKPPDEPGEEPEPPSRPPRCLTVDVPPDVHLPTCLDDVDEVVDSLG